MIRLGTYLATLSHVLTVCTSTISSNCNYFVFCSLFIPFFHHNILLCVPRTSLSPSRSPLPLVKKPLLRSFSYFLLPLIHSHSLSLTQTPYHIYTRTLTHKHAMLNQMPSFPALLCPLTLSLRYMVCVSPGLWVPFGWADPENSMEVSDVAALCCAVLYSTVLHCKLYCTVKYRTTLRRTIPYCPISCCVPSLM